VKLHEIDTPALLLDLDAMERNLAKMSRFFAVGPIRNAEHGIMDILDPSVALEVGDLIEVWAHYSDATVNLHERMYGIRNGEMEEILRLQG